MLWLVLSALRYRKQILLGVQLISELRKSAQDFTREYIRRRVQQSLFSSIVAVLIQIVLLLGALLWVALSPTLLARLIASCLLWIITGYNLYRFFFATLPEIQAVRKTLRGKMGYTLRYVLRISLVTELLQWNLIFPAICLGIALVTRSVLGSGVSFVAPWIQAFHQLNVFH